MNRSIQAAVLVTGLVGLAFITGCDSGPGPRGSNKRPVVSLTVPSAGERLPYTTTFQWAGSDSDGVIDHFEYAIDIPDTVSLDHLNDPDFEGVVWTPTMSEEMRFTFSTPHPDTVIENGMVVVKSMDIGQHCFYIRSVDDDGAPSSVEFFCFTAENVHPKTTIRVNCGIPILSVRHSYILRWSGEDPDSPDPSKKPAYYEWKKIPVASILALPSDMSLVVNISPGPQYPWQRADVESVFVDLVAPQAYVLAVRAVDVHGGTENRFIRCQNALAMYSLSSNPGTPLLKVSEPRLGTHFFPGDGPAADYDVPVGLELRFALEADATSYGGTIKDYNWGLNVSDLTNDAEFRGWSTTGQAGPFQLNTPGTHVLTVKARDDADQTVIGTILLRAVVFPRDREVLYIDDYRLSRQGSVSDEMMDARVIAMLKAAGYAEEDIYIFNPWGDDDLRLEPAELKLTDLAHYKLVLWSNFGSGFSGYSLLCQSAYSSRTIQAYVSAGGAIWFYGDQVMRSFGADSEYYGPTCGASLAFDESIGLNFYEIHFPCAFLKICGGDFREAKRSPQINGLLRALPMTRVANEMFPAMEVDSTVFFQPGIPYVDAMFDPIFAGSGLDTLYTMRAPSPGSSFNNKPVAFRYIDPDPASKTGAIAIFGFSYHLLKPGSGPERTGVHGMARSMVDWFKSHQRGGESVKIPARTRK